MSYLFFKPYFLMYVLMVEAATPISEAMSLDFIPSFTILRSFSISTSLDACPFTSTAGARPNVLRFFAAYSGVHLSLVTYITVRWSMRKGYFPFSVSLCISARRSASPFTVVSIFLYLSSIGVCSFLVCLLPS